MLITNKNGENPETRTGREATSSATSSQRSTTSSAASSSSLHGVASPACSSQALLSPPAVSRFRLLFDAALVEADDVLLLPLADIYEALANMMSSWNCVVFQVAVVDVTRKVERIRAAARDHPDRYRSMQSAADHERAVGRKEAAGEGITEILVSLHRTMRFTIAFLDGIRRAEPDTETSAIARDAYAASVARHHNWPTRKLASALMGSVPARRELMGSLLKQDGNGVSEAEFLDGYLLRAEILRERCDSILGKE